MAKNPLAAVLSAPASVPLYLRRFTIAAVYLTPQPPEDREVLEDAIAEFETALQLGFFGWAHFSRSGTARLKVEWNDSGFALHGEADGVHHNALVALLRLVVNLHHTPSQDRDSFIAALGEDAGELREPLVFGHVVSSVRVENLVGADDRLAHRTDFLNFVADAEIDTVHAKPFDDPAENWEGDRIVLAADLDVEDEERVEAVEDSFLRLYDSGCFVSLETIDELAGDPEWFFTAGEQTQIVIDDYEGDVYGLLELLNVLSAGHLSAFSAAAHGEA